MSTPVSYDNDLKYIDDCDENEMCMQEVLTTDLDAEDDEPTVTLKPANSFGMFPKENEFRIKIESSDNEDDDERVGMFHYFRQATSYDNKKDIDSLSSATNAQIVSNNDAAYDDAFNADSDIDSPRSAHSSANTAPEGTELKTFCVYGDGPYRGNYDEAVDVEDDDIESVTVQEAPRKRFTIMRQDDRKPYESSYSSVGVGASGGLLRSQSKTEVDEPLGLPLTPERNTNSIFNSSRHMKKIQAANVSPQFHSILAKQKSMSRPLEQFSDLSQQYTKRSIARDLSSLNKPTVESTAQSSGVDDTEEGTKKVKRKKKKKKSKSDDENPFDENGNPCDSSKMLSKHVGYNNGFYPAAYTNTVFQQSWQKHLAAENGDFSTDTSNPSVVRTKKLNKRKRAENEKKSLPKAGSIPGNCGEKNLDDLLEFIEGAPINKKNSGSVENKNNKKNTGKDKKVQMSQQSSASDKDVDSEEKSSNQNSPKNKKASNPIKGYSMPSLSTSPTSSDASLKKYISEPDGDVLMARLLSKEMSYDDVEIYQSQEEFTVVSKKKKNKTVSTPSSVYMGTSNSSKFQKFHFDRKPKSLPFQLQHQTPTDSESSTPSEKSNSVSSVPRTVSKDVPDFHPAAFPALGGETYEKVRRNSTGNAPSNNEWEVDSVTVNQTAESTPPDVQNSGQKSLSYASIAASKGEPMKRERRRSVGDVTINPVDHSCNYDIDNESCQASASDSDSVFKDTSDTGTLLVSCERSESIVIIKNLTTAPAKLPQFPKKLNGSIVNKKQDRRTPKNFISGSKTGTCKYKTSGVIFLDKKLAEAPCDIGITFGFDINEDITGINNSLPISEEPDRISFVDARPSSIESKDFIIPHSGMGSVDSAIEGDKNNEHSVINIPQRNGLYPSLCQPRVVVPIVTDQVKLMQALTPMEMHPIPGPAIEFGAESMVDLQDKFNSEENQSTKPISTVDAQENESVCFTMTEAWKNMSGEPMCNERGNFNVEEAVVYLRKAFNGLMAEKEKGSIKVVWFSELKE